MVNLKYVEVQGFDMKIDDILVTYRNVVVVGLSRDHLKDSNIVASYLKQKGYRIIPVNPFADELLGEKCYKSLLDIPESIQREIEVVDVFRPSEEVPDIVEQAIKLRKQFGNPKVVWLQLGIRHPEAALRAKEAGIEVVEGKCMMVEHRRLESL